MMKLHRVFIAINLPDDAKKQLLAYREKWPELPAKWAAEKSLHLTLAFLGNTSDQELKEVCKTMLKVGERHTPFTLSINRITYGPLRAAPKMIWAIFENSTELSSLHEDIANTLSQRDDKPFSPHLTLARLNMTAFRRMEPEEIPEVAEDISLSFEAESIEVIESELRRSGAQYTVCQSIPLQKK